METLKFPTEASHLCCAGVAFYFRKKELSIVYSMFKYVNAVPKLILSLRQLNLK
jgi:hypothetical protein